MAKGTLIQSIDRALKILELVSESETPVRNVDLAARMELDSHTTHNIVRSLYAHGYLRQDENSRYVLGPACLALQNRMFPPYHDLVAAAKEPIRELFRKNGDTTFLGAESHGMQLCLILVESMGRWFFQEKQDWLHLLHATAAGKIIIAEKGIDWFRRIAEVEKLEKCTEFTVVTVEGMAAEIAKVKRDGYALAVNEHLRNVASIGVAVRGGKGELLGALVQSFPDLYLENGRIDPAGRAAELQACATQITENFQKLTGR